MHRICGKRIPGGKKRGQRPQQARRKNRCHGAEHSCISLRVSLPLALCRSRFFSSICRSYGHREGSEAGGIRARVSEEGGIHVKCEANININQFTWCRTNGYQSHKKLPCHTTLTNHDKFMQM